MNETQVIAALAALAQQHRLRAYRALVVAGNEGVTAGILAEALGLSPAALSFHLKELTHAGLIAPVQEGRFMRYRANYASMTALLNYMTENCCAGKLQSCDAPHCCNV
ncbi:MAG: transcriptional regulator [Burkholderiaceae bacterium]|nr:MAG: transcriptional regulator [Burkholderiaceae bacterium]